MIRPFLILLSLLLVSSCSEKEIPLPTDGEPVFFIEALNNGIPIKLTAGVSDYYMYADHNLDKYDVFEHISRLSHVEAGDESLEIRIRSHLKSNGQVPDIRKSISVKDYAFKIPLISESYAGLKFNPSVSGVGPFTYHWDFGDGTQSAEESPIHRYDHPGFYRVTLSVRGVDTSTCMSSASNVVDMFNFTLENIDDCTAAFIHTDQGQNIVQFNSDNITADTYFWDFGDGTSSFGQNPSHSYPGPGKYKVMHTTYRQSDSCVAEMYRNISVGGGSASCLANFSIERITSGTPDSLALSKVTVIYTDKLGEEYRSDNLYQDEDSNFSISRIEDYKANEKGHPSLKYSCRFECRLSNSTGTKEVIFTKSKGDLALSYSP